MAWLGSPFGRSGLKARFGGLASRADAADDAAKPLRSVWRKAAVRLLFLAAICSAIFFLTERVSYRSTVDHARAETLESVGRLRLSFERALNADVQRVRGLVAYVRGNPGIDQTEFESVARYLLSDKTAFTRNVALARDLVITHIHPMKGNADALGLDYRDSAEQWPMVERTIRTQEIAIAGPLDLVQGGQGVIARVPVFLDGPDGTEQRLWGIASIVIDYEGLLRHVDLEGFRQDLAIRMSRVDPASETRSVFLAASGEVAEDPVSERVRFPNGAWLIEAAPRGGWPTHSSELWWIILATVLAFLVGLSLIAMNVRFESALVRSAAETERARRAAVEAKTLAEKANAAKTVFLANMSHELRTPLNAIIGYAEIMKTRLFGPLGNARYQGYVDDIHASGRFLLDIVDDVLDLSRLEATDQRLKPSRVDVREVLREALTVQGEAGADVRLEAEDGALAHADVRALKHVLINIIGNAIKHGEGARIEIRVLRRDRDWIAIRVVDHGPGIPPEVLPRVTEPFYTGTEGTWSAKAEGKGTGIGLALAKRLTEAMGGTLTLDSELGAGTTVEIALPAFADTAAA